MTLKVYADRLSQPSRAILIFCKMNGIKFEEVRVNLAKGDHQKADFKAINPMGQVPAIADGRFKLFESHAILIYLSLAFPGVADHWYPADLSRRARIHSALDWHHSNLRRGAAGLMFNSVIAPAFGAPLNPTAAAEAEKILISSLSKLESYWLQGKGKFLSGGLQPSIADISLVCEIMQLELLEETELRRILTPYKKVVQWIENTRSATSPHFEEIHALIYKAKSKFRKQSSATDMEPRSSIRNLLLSKL